MRYFYTLTLGLFAILQTGCSMTSGTFQPSTHFAFPNSNVQPLGHIDTSVSEGRFLLPPDMNKEKILKLINDSLAKKPGADMIVNYRLDTTYTFYPFPSMAIYIVQTIKMEGTAAKMEVGEKDLLEESNYN